MFAHFAFDPGYFGEGNIVRQEIQPPPWLYPIGTRVAIEFRDGIDRLRVAQERERRDESAGAFAGYYIELWQGERMHSRDPLPSFEIARAKRSPIAASGNNQDVEHRRRFRLAGDIL